MKKFGWVLALGIVTGLLGGGIILLVSRPPRGQPVTLLPLPTLAPLVVQVSGAVNLPGVYQLPAGSRVGDAIQAAGGFSPQAQTEAINLAMPLQDGVMIEVPGRAVDGLPGRSIEADPSLIDINTASQAVLESLPEIGEVTAQAIITYRSEHGPFLRIEELLDVPGIGPATFDQIRQLITVGSLP